MPNIQLPYVEGDKDDDASVTSGAEYHWYYQQCASGTVVLTDPRRCEVGL